MDCIKEEDKEEFLQKVIMNIASKSPQEVANAILTAALMQQSYEPVDDMTVLVCGLWEK